MMKLANLVIFAILYCTFAQVTDGVPPSDKNETVTILDLSNRNITSLKKYDFSKYPELEELDLSNNNIKHIKEDVFANNPKLKKLNLSGNTKLDIPQYSTLLIANIEEINLANCNIKKLPETIFDGLVNLKIIDLSDNQLVKNGIKLRTLFVLLNPEKLVLPHPDELLVKKICNELSITIEIKTGDTTDSIKCEPMKRVDDSDENPKLSTDLHIENNNAKETEQNKENHKHETVTDSSPTAETKELIPIHSNTPLEVQESTLKIAHTEITVADLPPESTTSTTTNETQIKITEAMEELQPTNTILMTEATEVKNDNIKIASTPKITVDTVDATSATEEIPAENSKNIIPLAILNSLETVSVTENNEVTIEDPHVNSDIEIPPPIGRSLPKAITSANQNIPVDNDAKITGIPPTNASKELPAQDDENKITPVEGIQEKSVAIETETAAQSTTVESSNTGTTILIFLIVGVVVSGLAAFGYKFYKSRKYQATNTTEAIERELKDIVIDKKENNVNHIHEEEPLMQKQINGTEVIELSSQTTRSSSVEPTEKLKSSNSRLNSIDNGPYKPTTTTFKPIE